MAEALANLPFRSKVSFEGLHIQSQTKGRVKSIFLKKIGQKQRDNLQRIYTLKVEYKTYLKDQRDF